LSNTNERDHIYILPNFFGTKQGPRAEKEWGEFAEVPRFCGRPRPAATRFVSAAAGRGLWHAHWRLFASETEIVRTRGDARAVRERSCSRSGCCLRPCLVHPKKQKVFKIPRHIESCGTRMKH